MTLRTPADIEQEIRHAIMEEEAALTRDYDIKYDGRHPPMGYRFKVYHFNHYVGQVYMGFYEPLDFIAIVQKYRDEKQAMEGL